MERCVKLVNLGRMSFQKALNVQNLCSSKLINKVTGSSATGEAYNTLILVEHPPVYTIGIRQKEYSNLDTEKLKGLGAEFIPTNRGGLITFHGPGQLVAYPILYLKGFKLGMRDYVCNLEKTVIELCKEYGIAAKTSPNTGVWVEDNKIAAVGVHGRRYVTTHGVAINCNTDLTWFDHIVPCGIEGKGVTSLSKELKKDVKISNVLPTLMSSFEKVFQCSAEVDNTWRNFLIENS